MTAPKPPEKTLLGMPSDVQAVLKKLDQQNQKAADPATRLEQQAVVTGERGAGSPRSSPPPLPLPSGQSVRPPPLPSQRAPGSRPPAPAPAPTSTSASTSSPTPLNKTLVGMPSDVQAVLQQALAQQPKAATAPEAPARARSTQRLVAQPVRTIGVPQAAAPEAPGRSASSPPQQPPSAAGFAAGPRSATHAQHTAAPTAARGLGDPARAAGSGWHSPVAPAHGDAGSTSSAAAVSGTPNTGAPGAASSTGGWDAEASRGAQPQGELLDTLSLAAPDVPPSVISPVEGSASTTTTPGGDLPEPPATSDAASAAAPRLALPLRPETSADPEGSRTSRTKPSGAASKRWLAIFVPVLMLMAGGGAVVLRAPQWLPGPLAAWIAPARGAQATTTTATPGQPVVAEEPQAPPDLPVLGATDVEPVAPTPEGEATTDTAAATDPEPAKVEAAAPAQQPTVMGAQSAAIEKQAIEQLMANDYTAAQQLYEKLRAAEPERKEYALMIELLQRTGVAACGQPGQPPCTGP